MDAFKIKRGGKILDYRKGAVLDLDRVRTHFEKRFKIVSLKQENRHVIGIFEAQGKQVLLKLSTTEGVGARTENEKLWNEEFNKHATQTDLRVPKNYEDGYYEGLYYIIMEKFDGPLLSGLHGENNIIEKHLNKIIDFSEYIQTLPLEIPLNDMIEAENHQKWFVAKTRSWQDAISVEIKQKYNLEEFFKIVEEGSVDLAERPRHGDFTPWHLIAIENGLALIDGEHAHSHGVEYYDICYFIQRVYSVLELGPLAQKFLGELLRRGYNRSKLKTVLASRAIGGFLDESFKETPSYQIASKFREWTEKL